LPDESRSSPGGADAVGGEDDAVRGDATGGARRVTIGDGADGGVGLDREGAGLGDELRVDLERARPGGEIGGAARARRAAEIAGAAMVAGAATAIGGGVDRGVRHPPLPAEPVEGGGEAGRAVSGGQRRDLARSAGRVGGISGEAADAHDPVVRLAVGREVVVGERPGVGDAVEAADLEVRGADAREMRAPVQGRAADGVVHLRLDGGARSFDG